MISLIELKRPAEAGRSRETAAARIGSSGRSLKPNQKKDQIVPISGRGHRPQVCGLSATAPTSTHGALPSLVSAIEVRAIVDLGESQADHRVVLDHPEEVVARAI